MNEDNNSDWEEDDEFDEAFSTNEVYEMFVSQQQQLKDTSKFLQLVLEVMQQKNSPPPDYQPLLMEVINKLQLLNKQHQLTKGNLESLEKSIKSINQFRDSFKEINSTINIQSQKIQELIRWRIALQIAIIVIPATIGLFISLYLLIVQNNSILEKKIDQINTRNEQIWKKVK
jgi:hypothetical protein